MNRKWSPSRGWEPLTEEQISSLAIARERFAETLTWAYYIGRMSPERLAQQRAYDKERGEKHYQERRKNVGRPAGRLRPKGERGGRVQVRAFPFAWLRSLVKNTLFDKIENCKNCIGEINWHDIYIYIYLQINLRMAPEN